MVYKQIRILASTKGAPFNRSTCKCEPAYLIMGTIVFKRALVRLVKRSVVRVDVVDVVGVVGAMVVNFTAPDNLAAFNTVNDLNRGA